ncbi:unnamed protein product [Dicrocoelium dendriticum]|nr:unnamed protein product [Dicrocoelium dendriticum]
MARNYNLMPDEADYEVCHNSILFRRYLRENLPNIRVVDQFEERISLQVDTSTMALFETILKMLLQAHQSGAIEDFSVSSPTLEHAYFELAKTQLRGTNSMTT